MNYFDYLTRLCTAPGPSGFEGPAVSAARELRCPQRTIASQFSADNSVAIRGHFIAWCPLRAAYLPGWTSRGKTLKTGWRSPLHGVDGL